MCRIGVARAWRSWTVAFAVAMALSGCSLEAFETRLADLKTSLTSHDIEVHKNKVMYVFRF